MCRVFGFCAVQVVGDVLLSGKQRGLFVHFQRPHILLPEFNKGKDETLSTVQRL